MVAITPTSRKLIWCALDLMNSNVVFTCINY